MSEEEYFEKLEELEPDRFYYVKYDRHSRYVSVVVGDYTILQLTYRQSKDPLRPFSLTRMWVDCENNQIPHRKFIENVQEIGQKIPTDEELKLYHANRILIDALR